MNETVRLFVGFDPREAAAYHVFCQSVIETSSVPVAFYPLHKGMLKGFDGQRDGTNAFIFSRYLVPYLCGYEGWAIFVDGDMIANADIAELWNLRACFKDEALAVVMHDYQTKHSRKYIGSKLENDNLDYPRKNWSSVILWNCGHPKNRVLTPEFVSQSFPTFMHRLQWLEDRDIGELPQDWNHLVGEYPPAAPALYHFTLGVPGIAHYADDFGSWKWHSTLIHSLQCAGEKPKEMVGRAESRIEF